MQSAARECVHMCVGKRLLVTAMESGNLNHSSYWNTAVCQNISLLAEGYDENVSLCPLPTQNTLHADVSYTPAWWQQVFWGIVFSLIVIIATGGNAIVIWIILAHRKMRTVTNYFLLNLSVTDILIATFNVIFSFIFMLRSHWPFGTAYCVFSNFVGSLSVSTSVFTMTAMSVDRFFAVVRPLKPRTPRRKIVVVIIIIWILGVILSLPALLYSTTKSYSLPGGNRTVCFLIWPDGISEVSVSDYVYNVIFLLVTYVVPMTFMVITYGWMGLELRKSKCIGELANLQRESIKSKHKVVRMLVVVVLTFAVCWLPYHVYFLYTYHHKEVLYTEYVQHVYLSIYWLAMSNSMYNPVVYYWMNRRFRTYFQKILCCCKEIDTSHIVSTRSVTLPTSKVRVIHHSTIRIKRHSTVDSSCSPVRSEEVNSTDKHHPVNNGMTS